MLLAPGVALCLFSLTVSGGDLASDSWYDELARDFWFGPSLLKWLAGAVGLVLVFGGGTLAVEGWQDFTDSAET